MNRAVLLALKARCADPRWAVIDRANMTPTTRPPAVVIDAPSLARTTDRFDGADVMSDGWVQTTILAESVEQAAWMQDRLDDLLVGHVLVLPGGLAWSLEQYTAPRPVSNVDGLPEGRMYLVATRWAVHAEPAA